MLRAKIAKIAAIRAEAESGAMEPAETSRRRGRQVAPQRTGLGPDRSGDHHLVSVLGYFDQPVALFDAEDRLEKCNAAYRDLFVGDVAATLDGRHYEQILHAWTACLQFPTEREAADFQRQRLLQRHEERVDFDVLTKTGRNLRVRDRRTPEGTLLTTITDRTEDERLLAEQREARRVAEEASASKSQFLCSMSHELRTPLNVILGFSQLMQRDGKLPLPDRHRLRVEQILKGGNHLLRIIEDLLDLSRIEAGRLAYSLEPVNVSSVLEQLQTALGPSAASAGVQLEISNTCRAPIPLISADPTRYLQILLNFGSNAIKYNKPSGMVCFTASLPRSEAVRVSVRDTGVGIPAHQHAALFHTFQRAGQEAGKIEGTGLGLVITKRLAELMKGSVGFHSVPSQGSEFWVDMPVHAAGASGR